MLDTIIKAAFETEGTLAVGAPVTVEEVSVSLFSGEVLVSGLSVAGEPGGRFPEALRVTRLRARADPWSLAGGRLSLGEVTADGVVLYLELGGAGLSLARLGRRAGGAGGRALSIERLRVEDARVSALILGRTRTLALPDLELERFGPGTGLGDAVQVLLAALAERALEAVRGQGTGQRRRRRL